MARRNMLALLFERINLEKQILALLLMNVLVSGFPQKSNEKSNTTFNFRFVADPVDVEKCRQDPFQCTNLSYYPKEYIANLMNSKKKLIKTDLLWLNDDVKKTDSKRNKRNIECMDDDVNENESDMKQFCNYKELFMYPEMGFGKNAKPFFIVQLPEENFTQGIRVQTCVSGGVCERLSGIARFLPMTQCVQQKSYKMLNVLSHTTGEIVQRMIEMPSSCVCKYLPRDVYYKLS